MLSTSEKRAIDLSWAKPFDGNSPLIRYILEVSENSESESRSAFDALAFGMAFRDLRGRFLWSCDVLFWFFCFALSVKQKQQMKQNSEAEFRSGINGGAN